VHEFANTFPAARGDESGNTLHMHAGRGIGRAILKRSGAVKDSVDPPEVGQPAVLIGTSEVNAYPFCLEKPVGQAPGGANDLMTS
jgi:hypothetical protein